MNLQAEQAKLSDKSYVEQVARQEIGMCFPGTQCYVVIEGRQPLINGTRPQPSGPAPWYAKLWQSVEQADASPAR